MTRGDRTPAPLAPEVMLQSRIRPVFGSLRRVFFQPVESRRPPAVDAGLDVASDVIAGAGAVVQFGVAHQGGLEPDGLHHFAR